MTNKKSLIIYIILALLMALDLYSIFNAGNPNSFIRHLVPDPGYDFLITAIISLLIVASVLILNSGSKNNDDPVFMTLRDNSDHIQKLRSKGKSDEEIASSFVKNLKETGVVKKLAYKKALKYLKRI